MPSLMVDYIISLDGYASADGWPGYWGLEGPEYLAWLDEPAEHEHTVLMGATTYRLMSGFATDMPDESSLSALTAMPRWCSHRPWSHHCRGQHRAVDRDPPLTRCGT